MDKNIVVREGGLSVQFQVREDGIVELSGFSPVEMNVSPKAREDVEIVSPLVEVQITGKSTRGMHAYKHNSSSASLDFHYREHKLEKWEKGKELQIFLDTEYGLEAVYHMKFFDGVAVVQAWTQLNNKGREENMCPLLFTRTCVETVNCPTRKRPTSIRP